jgi:hypothetical protein
MSKIVCFLLSICLSLSLFAMDHVGKWDIFEVQIMGPSEGNPYLDIELSAEFKNKNRIVPVTGFYDGGGRYKIRFMPDTEGNWTYKTVSNTKSLNNKKGQFICDVASDLNHGPVYIRDKFHFAYADGTPYYPFGTTCYAWIHQENKLEEQTLETLASSPFNKIRFCVFPKDYTYSKNEPIYYPFEKKNNEAFDFTKPNYEFYHHFEKRLAQLKELNIEADIILWHPYDHWGFKNMGKENDDRYLRYMIARISSYRNVWWSLANEFQFVRSKDESDWDRFFKILQTEDPYQHLRSIHNHPQSEYNWAKPWITHVSVQDEDMRKGQEWRNNYGKAVINDECQYEGNIFMHWGNISGHELVHRFWLGMVNGCYATHGETFTHPEDILWWSKGGKLYGESPDRIAFLRKIIEQAPPDALNSIGSHWTWNGKAIGKKDEYYLLYFGSHQPDRWTFETDTGKFKVDIINPWEMTFTPVEGVFEGKFEIKLPSKPYLSVRVQKINK